MPFPQLGDLPAPGERVDEFAARVVVSHVLGHEVLRHEDGKENHQVDAVIQTPTEQLPLEVIGDRDPAAVKQWRALRKYGHFVDLPTGSGTWYVTINPSANVRELHRAVPPLIATGVSPKMLPGVVGADLLPAHDESPSRVYFMVNPIGEWAGGEINPWISRLLLGAPDLALKLGRHTASERHLFVWATTDTEYSVRDFLEDDLTPLPKEPARLPPEITHLWVASAFKGEGCLRWDPAIGWIRTGWKWPGSMG